MQTDVRFARALRIGRAVRGYTRAELARRAGLSPSMITLAEQGKRRLSWRAWEDIACALAVSLPVLHLLAEPPHDSPLNVAALRFLLGGTTNAAD